MECHAPVGKVSSSFITEFVGKYLYIIYGKLAIFKEDNGVGRRLFKIFYILLYNNV